MRPVIFTFVMSSTPASLRLMMGSSARYSILYLGSAMVPVNLAERSNMPSIFSSSGTKVVSLLRGSLLISADPLICEFFSKVSSRLSSWSH